MASVLVWILKNWKALDFSFFVGDVISGVGSSIFGQGHRALSPNCKNQFSTQIFVGN